jgi:hypothetical protein
MLSLAAKSFQPKRKRAVKIALRNMLVRVGADVSGLKKGMQDAQKSVGYFGRSISGAFRNAGAKVAGGLAMVAGGMGIKAATDDAMKYEALMTTLGESMGNSRKDFEHWQETVGTAMGFSRLQGAKLANTLALNFKMIATSQADLTDKTIKMMQVAAIVSNKRGMGMEDVSDRIRSAMNQEADGADELGVNVRIAAIQQSKAYAQMANGKPWDQLSTNMQRTILYSHILESVTNNLGTTMQDNTAMRMGALTASLADVKLALGQAFLPIMYNVLPLLTTLAQYLYKTLQVVAAFTKALFGGFNYGKGGATQLDLTNKQTDAVNKQAGAVGGLGKAQEKAGKKAKKAAKDAKGGVAAFDEVNTLAEKSGAAGAGAGAGGGGGGVGGAAMPAMPQMTIPTPDASGFIESINEMVEHFKKVLAPLKEFFMNYVWGPISSFFKTKVAEMQLYWQMYGADFMGGLKAILKFIMPIILFVANFIWESVKGAIDGILRFFKGLMKFIGGIFAGDWKRVWEGLKDMIFGALQAIWNITNLTFVGRIFGVLKLFLKFGKSIITGVVKFFVKNFENFAKTGIKAVSSIWYNIKAIFTYARIWWTRQLLNWALRFYEFGVKAGRAGKSAWEAIKKVFKGAGEWFLRSVITPIVNRFDRIKNAFKGGFTSGIKAILNTYVDLLNAPIKALKSFGVGKKKPFAFLPTFHHLAQGGITTGPTYALIGEGREDEAVAPLSKLQGMITSSVVAAMKAGGSGGGNVILNIDGRQFARLIKPHLEREHKRVGTNVRLNNI